MSTLHEKFKVIEVVIHNNGTRSKHIARKDYLRNLAIARTTLAEIMDKYPKLEERPDEHLHRAITCFIMAVATFYTIILPYLLYKLGKENLTLRKMCKSFMNRLKTLAQHAPTVYDAVGNIMSSGEEKAYTIPACGRLRELVFIHMPTLHNTKLLAKHTAPAQIAV